MQLHLNSRQWAGQWTAKVIRNGFHNAGTLIPANVLTDEGKILIEEVRRIHIKVLYNRNMGYAVHGAGGDRSKLVLWAGGPDASYFREPQNKNKAMMKGTGKSLILKMWQCWSSSGKFWNNMLGGSLNASL